MKPTPIARWRDRLRAMFAQPLCWGAALFVAVALLLAHARAPLHEAALAPSSMQAEQGQAWLAPVPALRSLLYRVWGPDVGRAPSGELLLLEDGVPMTERSAPHAQIRELGGGRYSHWGNDVYFSTPDGSDPRSNGRSYAIRIEARLRGRWLIVGLLMALYAPFGAAAWWRRRPESTRAAQALARTAAAVAAAAALLLALQLSSWVVPLTRTHAAGDPGTGSEQGLRVVDLRSHSLAGMLSADERAIEVEVAGKRLQPAPPHGRMPAGSFRAETDLVLVSAPADVPVAVHVPWRATPALMFSTLALLLVASLSHTLIGGRADRASPGAATLVSLLEPRELAERWSLLFAFGGALVSAALLWHFWRLGASGHLGAAALLPVSDALGYYRCALLAGEPSARAVTASAAEAVAHYGMPAEWCSRRVIWPMTLLSLLWGSGWRAGLALMFQAALIGAALGVAVRATWRLFGAPAALALGAVGLLFAMQWSIGTFMTEVYGMAAGFVGAALLMRHAERRDALALAAGLALLSLALTARAGALFALPLLAVWGYLSLRPPGRWIAPRAAVVVVFALAAGPLLQWLGALHYLGEATNTGGNFAASLYGLSTGSRDWAQAYRDFAPLFAARPEAEVFAHIQQRAIENIRAQPEVLLESLRQAGTAFVRAPFALTDELAASNTPATLMWLGAVYALWRWREPRFALLLAVFAGECLAAPLIIDSGGARVFAATMWVRPLLAGVGVLALVRLLARLARQPLPALSTGAPTSPRTAYALSALLVALPTLALVAPTGLLQPPVTDSRAQCRPDETPMVARLGRESMALTVGSPGSAARAPLDGPLEVAPGQADGDAVWRGAWWAGGVGELPPGRTLLLAFDAQRNTRGRLLSLVVDEPLLPDQGGLLHLCAGTDSGVKLGDFGLRQARVVR